MPSRVADVNSQPLLKIQHPYFCKNGIHLKVCKRTSKCVKYVLKNKCLYIQNEHQERILLNQAEAQIEYLQKK